MLNKLQHKSQKQAYTSAGNKELLKKYMKKIGKEQ